MAIQIRRGASEDFDASKMVAGELGVATDGSHKMWATGQAGDSWELASKEDLDEEVEARETLAETVEAQGESLDGKAEVDGMYDDLYAGGLTTDKKQTDSVPYLMRKTGGTLSRVGERCYDTIIGASVGENQLVQSGATSVTIQSGHKYYAKINGTESLGASTGSAITINDSAKDMVIDLTQMLGSSIADYVYSLGSNGIAKLRSCGFLRGYQAFNAGSIESVEVTGKKVRGFNQWNEEWESGQYTISSGEKGVRADAIRCKNMIPVMPNTAYYFHCGSHPTAGDGVWLWYGIDGSYIGNVTGKMNREQTSPYNAYFMTFYVAPETTYNHDICINLSSDRNGEYEAYSAQEYDYGNDTLRGIFKLDASNNLYADGDRKTSDGTITRKYSIADLWTRDWVYADGLFRANIPNFAAPQSYIERRKGFINSKYPADTQFSISSNAMTDKTALRLGGVIYIKDSAYTDVTTFIQMLTDQNVKMVYELATPTTEQGDPFPSPQVCYPDGTEEYVTSNGVPVGHSTEYPYDLKGLVEGLIDVPDVPSTNGTYVLKATRSASGLTYTWVADSAVSLASPLMSASPQTQESTEEEEEEGESR